VKNTIASARSYLRMRLPTWMFLRAHLVKGDKRTLSDDWRRNQPLILSRQILAALAVCLFRDTIPGAAENASNTEDQGNGPAQEE
jgi:hypothetical protein